MNAFAARAGLDIVRDEHRFEAGLWRRFRESGCVADRQRLFDHYLPYARKVAFRQMSRRPSDNFDREDVEQLAFEALLQSIDRYDPLRDVPFRGFARKRIEGNISNYISRSSEATAHYKFWTRADKERLQSLKREPSDTGGDPIAALAELTAELALGFMLGSDRSGDDRGERVDPAPSAYDTLAWRDLNARLHDLIDQLPEKEGFVVHQHYRNHVGFGHIGDLMGLSKGRVSQLHRSALSRLRKQMSRYR